MTDSNFQIIAVDNDSRELDKKKKKNFFFLKKKF